MKHPVIRTDNLSHTFPDGREAIRRINLEIFDGEFILMAGKNGSGKTTLLRHMNGLLLPTKGEVYVDGQSVTSDPGRARTIVGMVFQEPDTQIVGESVREDVAFGPENLGLPLPLIRRRVDEALDLFQLTSLADKNPLSLSGGEKRRLALAGVLAMDPRVVVMDEPFSNLDYPGALELLSCITTLKTTGKTLIITTHDVEKIIWEAGRMMILDNGSLIHDGRPAELIPYFEASGIAMPCSARFGLGVQPWRDNEA